MIWTASGRRRSHVHGVGRRVPLQTEDPRPATPLFEEALSLSPDIRDWEHYLWVLFTLGAAERVAENYVRAQACYEQVLVLMRERQVNAYLDWSELLASALAGLGGLAIARGRAAQAARLFGAASHKPDPGPVMFFRIDRQGDVAAARAELGEAEFDAAFGEGQAMTTDQAIDLALREARRRSSADTRAPISERSGRPRGERRDR